MSVSWRHMLACAGVAVFAGGGLTALGQQAQGCCKTPKPPPPPKHDCCKPPKNLVVNVPGVSVATANVNVGATSTVVASAGVSATLSSGVVVSGDASGGAFAFGGGGGFYSNPGVPQSSITGLTLAGDAYCVDRIVEEFQVRPVQALCIDDKNTPHPASRLDDGDAVDGSFSGEVYRCISGTRMQVTLGHMVNGQASFASGETFSCLKGESLWHSPGGQLACRPQTPERNCNERSLLRKFGPGVKLVSTGAKRTVCEPVTGKVEGATRIPRAISAGDLVLDGGVGQGF
jgi:hypothetical protein